MRKDNKCTFTALHGMVLMIFNPVGVLNFKLLTQYTEQFNRGCRVGLSCICKRGFYIGHICINPFSLCIWHPISKYLSRKHGAEKPKRRAHPVLCDGTLPNENHSCTKKNWSVCNYQSTVSHIVQGQRFKTFAVSHQLV